MNEVTSGRLATDDNTLRGWRDIGLPTSDQTNYTQHQCYLQGLEH
jgi:hypothetical protein